jgi:hypothetical protein
MHDKATNFVKISIFKLVHNKGSTRVVGNNNSISFIIQINVTGVIPESLCSFDDIVLAIHDIQSSPFGFLNKVHELIVSNHEGRVNHRHIDFEGCHFFGDDIV